LVALFNDAGNLKAKLADANSATPSLKNLVGVVQYDVADATATQIALMNGVVTTVRWNQDSKPAVADIGLPCYLDVTPGQATMTPPDGVTYPASRIFRVGFVASASTAGSHLLTGAGAPGGGLGVDGDYYIDTAANSLYGPKAGGVWGAGVTTYLNGVVPPTPPDGADGDYFIDTLTHLVYGPKAGGVWPVPGVLLFAWASGTVLFAPQFVADNA
jgi:hypothetical protein